MSMPTDIRAFNQSIIEEFRANGGQVSHEMFKGVPLVLLNTTGAKSGRPHTVPLGFFDDGPGRMCLWASAMAAPKHPAWYLNLAANPRVTLELRSEAGVVEKYAGTASTTEGAERDRLVARLAALMPAVVEHQKRTDREIPLVLIEYPV